MRAALALLLLVLGPPPAQPAPGFTITLDGGAYEHQRITLKPVLATYCNNYWNSSRDPRINRLALCADGGNGALEMQINLPATVGPYVFDKSDQEAEGRNPYLGFELIFDKYGVGQTVYETGHVEVVITKIDPPGGRIEGTLSGTLSGPHSVIVNVTGAFSVVRQKDRVVL